MQMLRTLVVDDNDLVLQAVADLFRQRGDYCVCASSAEEALQNIQDNIFDLLVSDIVMPAMDGLELIRRAKILQPTMVCILMSGVGSRRDIIAALQIGVFDFMDKPVPDIASFNMIIDRAADRSRLIRERDALLENLKQQNVKLEFSLQRLHEAFGQLRQQEEELESDLLRAQQVQKRFLPTDVPVQPGLECFAYFGPCDQVGGDFFGTFQLSDGRTVAYLLDVAGHGVSAAIVTVTMRELMRARRRQDSADDLFAKPAELLAFMNEAVIEEQFDPPVLVTMLYAVLDPTTGHSQIAGAGHPAPLLVRADGSADPVPMHGAVLGAKSSSQYTTVDVPLAVGDTLLFYSDGLTEARNSSNKEFSTDHLMGVLKANQTRSASEMGSALEAEWMRFLDGAAPIDDMTFIVLKHTDPTPPAGAPAGPSIHFAMPEKLRAASVNTRGRIRAGWNGSRCLTTFSGMVTWQLAPPFREVVHQAHEGKANAIDVDLAACESMDSTMLGLILQHANELVLHQPGGRVVQQLHDLGVLERVSISHEICPRIEHPMEVSRIQTREACSELILSAHEALMEASVDNRLRFQDVVGSMKENRDKPPKPAN
jgi:serine phosphatase RsbU (regulator of sigma subunit)